MNLIHSIACRLCSSSSLHARKIDRWKKNFSEKDFIKFNKGSGYKEKKPECKSGDYKRTFISTSSGLTRARINLSAGKGKRNKFLGVILKWIWVKKVLH